jgi:hypothetical protein
MLAPVLLLVAAMAAYMVARRRYRHLPSPGIYLPFIGHIRVGTKMRAVV